MKQEIKQNKITSIIIAIAFMLSLIAASAHAVSLTINKVEVNGVTLTTDSVNRLNLERGEELKVRVEATGTANNTDVEIEAFISGYEYNDKERMSDTTHVFDVEQGVTYSKTLNLRLPTNVERDNYKLRIAATDRYGTAEVYNYNLKISTARHSIMIKDLILNPESGLQAGRALLTTLRLRNNGEQDEEGIRAEVSIPELGISATHYIDELESDQSTTTEEMYMRIPTCAKEGVYLLKAEVSYDEGYETVNRDTTIRITPSGECALPGQAAVPATLTVIAVGTESQQLVKGQGGAVYPITITNNAKNTRTFVLSTEGISDFATARFSPSNIVQVEGESSKTVYLYLTALNNAKPGERTFVVNVQSDQGVKQVVLKANVAEKGTNWESIKTAFEILLIVLVFVLLAFGIAMLLGKRKEEEQEKTEEKKKNSGATEYY